MTCYFCAGNASVLCQKCGRYACNRHSRKLGDRFFCIEDALGGSNGVFQEAYKTALAYAEHPTQRCSVCQKGLLRLSNFSAVKRDFALDNNSIERIRGRLVQNGMEVIDNSKMELEGPKCHNFCSVHFPKPIRIYQTTESGYATDYGKIVKNIAEFAEFECPVCKGKWSMLIRRFYEQG